MSRLQNNWAAVPDVSTRVAMTKHKPAHDSGEDPDEVSVPEGPPSGSLAYRRGASARGARTSAGALSSAGGILSSTEANSRSAGGVTTGPHQGGYMNSAAAHASQAARHTPANHVSHEDDSDTEPVVESYGSAHTRYNKRSTHATSTNPQPAAPAAAASRKPAPLPPPDIPALPQRGFTNSASTNLNHQPQPPNGIGAAPRGVPSSGAGAAAPRRVHGSAGGPQYKVPVGRRGEDMLVEDMDDLSLDSDLLPLPGPASNAMGTTLRGGSGASQPKGAPLAPGQARAVSALLWGAQGQPPPSWQQGFFFNTSRGLQHGLVQVEGGPCGVLASVQAHVLACLRTQSGSLNLEPSQPEQHEALVASLADIVWQARVGPCAYVAVAWGEGGAPASSLGHDQMLRSITVQEATSKEQLKAAFAASLGCYMDRGGWGVLLLLYSVLLSHGVSNVRDDMDEPSNALMGMHGYCTQELVNLLITGQAASNVFDGHKDLDGSKLHGITRRCRVGLLTLFEWYKYVEVGSCLKSPDLPIWVVCSESHFTVLFAQDAKAQRGEMPFDLFYYDELANQQAPIRLTIKRCLRGGWTARVGDNFADRGKCEGQNIPPLECVIETRWPGVNVNWNGTDPIL